MAVKRGEAARGVAGAEGPDASAHAADRRAGSRAGSGAPTSPPTSSSRSRRSSATGSSAASSSRTTSTTSTSGPRCSAGGACAASKGGSGPSYEELVETEGRPRIRAWLDRIQSEQMLEAGVVYGYFRAVSKNEDLIVLGDEGEELHPLHLPAAAARPAAVHRRLLQGRGVGGDRRRRLPHGDGRLQDQHGDAEAVRAGRLPRLPRAARPLRAARRGAGRVLARAGPRRARLRRRRQPRHRRADPAPGLPRLALLVRLRRPAPTSRTGRRSSVC